MKSYKLQLIIRSPERKSQLKCQEFLGIPEIFSNFLKNYFHRSHTLEISKSERKTFTVINVIKIHSLRLISLKIIAVFEMANNN